jgi:hypothetical protein
MTTLPNEIGGIHNSYERRLSCANQSRSYQTQVSLHPNNRNRKHMNNSNDEKVMATIDHHQMIENGWIASEQLKSSSILNDNVESFVNQTSMERTNIVSDDMDVGALEFFETETETIRTNISNSCNI